MIKEFDLVTVNFNNSNSIKFVCNNFKVISNCNKLRTNLTKQIENLIWDDVDISCDYPTRAFFDINDVKSITVQKIKLK